ncbi:hypothetical protein TNCV_1692531 [Trichonephila clavipes]|nr:hypothetical protein TNCV_1692531 [Trichonephila clavipes]
MFDPSSFVNPTPLAHADASRYVLPRGDRWGSRIYFDSYLSLIEMSEDSRSLIMGRPLIAITGRPFTKTIQTRLSTSYWENKKMSTPLGTLDL